MNRVLRRPMFRMGGSAGEGITSGLAPRQGYNTGLSVKPINFEGTQAEWEAHLQNLREKKVGPFSEYSLSRKNIVPDNTDSTDNNFVGDDTGTQNIIDKVTEKKSILDAIYPRQKTDSMAGANFLMNLGVDLASRPRSGNIFQQVATSAKNPLLRFQEEKLMEQAAGRKETSEDRALLAKMLEGMDDDKLSALMKDVKAGVEAGEFPDEATGIKLMLKKKIYGVLDAPGEKKQEWIKWYMTNLQNKADVDPGVARVVAEHQYKMDFKEYPPEILKDLNRTKMYIKETHIVGRKRDENDEIIELIVNANQARTYRKGQIYIDPQSGELFKNVSKEGEAPRFVKVIFN
jgi:hypothetical protein